MAIAIITTVPATLVFLIAQRRVMQGMADGSVKG
jgi:ABC-type glycerol-3-phosphate transport system permease component